MAARLLRVGRLGDGALALAFCAATAAPLIAYLTTAGIWRAKVLSGLINECERGSLTAPDAAVTFQVRDRDKVMEPCAHHPRLKCSVSG